MSDFEPIKNLPEKWREIARAMLRDGEFSEARITRDLADDLERSMSRAMMSVEYHTFEAEDYGVKRRVVDYELVRRFFGEPA